MLTMNFLHFFNKKSLTLVVYVFIALAVINAFFVFYLNTKEIERKDLVQMHTGIDGKVNDLKIAASVLDANIARYTTMAATGAFSKDLHAVDNAYDSLHYNLQKHAYPLSLVTGLEATVEEGIAVHNRYLATLQQGDSADIATTKSEVMPLLPAVDAVGNAILQHEQKLVTETTSNQATLLQWLVVMQVGLLLCIPFMILLGFLFGRNRNKLVSLADTIKESNQQYVFNSGIVVDEKNEEAIKKDLLENLRRATEFIQRIAAGDYSALWDGMDDTNRELNTNNIAGELIKMREQMKQVKEEDRIRIWSTEGLSKFGDIIRTHQNNFSELSDNLISNVVKYVGAKVGGLYILEEDEDGERYLLLRACYAYERKKYVSKRLEIGEGLVGQTFIEGKTIYLEDVPDDYLVITSGLGEVAPKSLLIVPLKVNDKIEGVLELASLKPFASYEIDFFEKLGETLAASIVSVRSGEKTQKLLVVSQEQTEEMRAQEEEMRQNMEELEATQEQMNRQMSELSSLKNEMEREEELFRALMDHVPDAIYFKDKESKFLRVSKYLADHFKANVNDLIGKSDFDFQDAVHAKDAFDDEQNIMNTRTPKIDFVEREVKPDGSEHFVSTTKMPLLNTKGDVIGTFGISRDVSKLKRLEIEITNKDKKLREEEAAYHERIRLLEMQMSAKDEEIQELKKKQ